MIPHCTNYRISSYKTRGYYFFIGSSTGCIITELQLHKIVPGVSIIPGRALYEEIRCLLGTQFCHYNLTKYEDLIFIELEINLNCTTIPNSIWIIRLVLFNTQKQLQIHNLFVCWSSVCKKVYKNVGPNSLIKFIINVLF